MSTIPKHIEEKIEEKYNETSGGSFSKSAAIFGYQLATEELEKELAYIKDTLDDCREYMDDKADVDVGNDYFVPNKEAKLLSRIDSTIEKLNKHYGRK